MDQWKTRTYKRLDKTKFYISRNSTTSITQKQKAFKIQDFLTFDSIDEEIFWIQLFLGNERKLKKWRFYSMMQIDMKYDQEISSWKLNRGFYHGPSWLTLVIKEVLTMISFLGWRFFSGRSKTFCRISLVSNCLFLW